MFPWTFTSPQPIEIRSFRDAINSMSSILFSDLLPHPVLWTSLESWQFSDASLLSCFLCPKHKWIGFALLPPLSPNIWNFDVRCKCLLLHPPPAFLPQPILVMTLRCENLHCCPLLLLIMGGCHPHGYIGIGKKNYRPSSCITYFLIACFGTVRNTHALFYSHPYTFCCCNLECSLPPLLMWILPMP